MGTVLHSAVAFILAVGLLVMIHEFGHYWVARRLGVKILRFSIGFGRPLWGRRVGADQMEFVVSAIPLGGYVKMLDEREGEVAEEELPRAFNRQPLSTRFAVVVAGPLFNFLFAIAAYWLIFVVGVSGVKPIIGEVVPDSPAALAGFVNGQEIIEVDGEPTPTWAAFINSSVGKILDEKRVNVMVRDALRSQQQLQLDFSVIHVDDISSGNFLQKLGVRPFRPSLEPVIGEVVPGGAAERAGLQAGDRISAADGYEINTWQDWVDYVKARPEVRIRAEVLRDDATEIVEIVPEMKEEDGEKIGRIGAAVRAAELSPEYIAVEKYSPFGAFGQALSKTWEMSVLTLRLLGKMLFGEASVRNLSGPISIAQYAGQSASIGFTAFLSFLAIVSVSLGVLNLLPIPVLDGGHLLYYVIELISRRPVSENVQIIGQQVGMVILMALMSLAFYNDILRIFS